jgi:hypothetical protein
MKKIITLSLASTIIALLSNSALGQSSVAPLIDDHTVFTLRNDTLYSNDGIKLFAGQKLIIGTPSGDAGQYRSIISRKAAIVPSIWRQDPRYENAIENYVDTKKNKEKLKNSLIPGNLLTIQKIILEKTGRPHFYLAVLSSDSIDCKCDITLALALKEILLQP